ncbi:uncharacterized protein EI97DRAFT_27378 [Westerdykella ornata]|uniref:endo-1,3(4)-beta-glucanase n=1 Tax=Westerdykella ornata TaxID=318751 RepID=A0A6A6JXL6_WESOR|nr:uncharacterized protein EI97DRAFT_27378 [Westerdykella ornata]KAF2281362.1 hypothetical protein EI97DRAFT_27378 [Westerdykella ornata]
MHFSTFLSGAALLRLSIAGYVLEDDYMKDFFGSFDFFTAPDPTQGFVQYVDQSLAQQMGLINSSSTGPITLAVDSTKVTPQGRPSVRLSSKKTYNSGLLVVLDVSHMPTGCGTWPAFWMVGPNWPFNGEIDILEGVNDQQGNAMTLHTGPGCSISTSPGAFTGEARTDNCDIHAPDQLPNAGCSIESPSTQSYGAGLNEIQGGVYATLWTDEAISVYFFPRTAIPADVLGDAPDPSSWGTPMARFAGAGCDVGSVFRDQQIVIDTTFCGVWAGAVWGQSETCKAKAATCEDYVRDHPEAFGEAYWSINALRVYRDDGEGVEPEPSEPVPSSTAPSLIPSGGVPVESPGQTSSAPGQTSPLSSGKPIQTTTKSVVDTPFSLPTNATSTSSVRSASRTPTAPSATGTPVPPTSIAPSVPSAAPPQSTLTSTTTSQNQPSAAPKPLPTNAPGAGAGAGAGAGNGPLQGFQWPLGPQQDDNSGNPPSLIQTAPTSTAKQSASINTTTPALPTPPTLTASTTPTPTSTLPLIPPSSAPSASFPAQEAPASPLSPPSSPPLSKTCTAHTVTETGDEDLAIPIPTGRDRGGATGTGTSTGRKDLKTVFVTVTSPLSSPAPAQQTSTTPGGARRRGRNVRRQRQRDV